MVTPPAARRPTTPRSASRWRQVPLWLSIAVGVAPAEGEILTFLAGPHGGNLDDHMNGIGATLHIPVFQPGALLAIGDMHASMGDGEISKESLMGSL